MQPLPFALQLYSVRELLEQDAPGTLRRLKEAGYDHVETAGFAGRSAREFKALLDAAGVRAVSAHIGVEELFGDLSSVISDIRALEVHYAVAPWLGEPICTDKPTWMAAIRRLDAVGEQLRREGIQLCYHNHEHEFAQVEGDKVLDLIFQNAEAQNLAVELDTCWAHVGKADVPALMRHFGRRLPLLHLKDYCRDEAGNLVFRAIGRGIMEWEPIFEAAEACHVAWYVVEQDQSEGDPIDSVRMSAEYLMARSK